MKKLFKVVICALLCVVVMGLFPACSKADVVNHNVSRAAQNFEVERRITVYNARTDTIILYAEGYMNISNDSHDELVVTVKTGKDEFKKNYIYLNEYTLYVVEDITGYHTDPYHYKIYFNAVLPDIEVNP